MTRLSRVIMIGLLLSSVASLPPLANADYYAPLPRKVDVYVWWMSDNSYFNITLKNFDPDYYPPSDNYRGWCLDTRVRIQPNQWYKLADLYHSLMNDSMPDYMKDDEDMNMINYILNQWYNKTVRPDPDPYSNATWREIQQAIWVFADEDYNVNDYDDPWGDPDIVDAIVEDAEANGEDFVPTEGQVLALIIDVKEGEKQLIAIAVEIPPNMTIPEIPFGTITALLTMLGILYLRKRAL